MMLSLTTMLPVEDRHIGICQKNFSVFEWDIAVADKHIPVRNFDVVSKMDGICGQTTEHRSYRTQVPDWRRQNPRLKTQFRVAKCEKLWSINGKWQSINGTLRSMKTMPWSDLRRPKSGKGMRWFLRRGVLLLLVMLMYY
ncbi:MAG: hypothetical protein LBG80_15405 [Bacteroidales bacterium]|jgi:hypothetical protein|nr:hypothetical protein [Bacteroidales bacterium]